MQLQAKISARPAMFLVVAATVVVAVASTLAARSRGMPHPTPSAAVAQDRVWPANIPLALHDRRSGSVRHGFQRGFVDLRTAHKLATFKWTAGSHANSPPGSPEPIPTYPAAMDWFADESQDVRLRYYPLLCTVVDATKLVMAGVDGQGRTVLEEWALQWPAVMPAPEGPSGASEPVAVSVVLPQRVVRRFHEADVPGRSFVASMVGVARASGPPTQLVVQYRDSMEVFLVEIADGAHALLASPTDAGAVLGAIPLLGQQSMGLGRRRHATRGFVYNFTNWRPRTDISQLGPGLVMFDEDMDGVIESYQVVPAAEFYGPGG